LVGSCDPFLALGPGSPSILQTWPVSRLLLSRSRLSRHDEVHDESLLAARLPDILTMDDLAPFIFQLGYGPRLPLPFALIVQRASIQNDLGTVELTAALSERHAG